MNQKETIMIISKIDRKKMASMVIQKLHRRIKLNNITNYSMYLFLIIIIRQRHLVKA